MSTKAHYHPRDLRIDLGDKNDPLPRWLYDEIVSRHGHIPPPPAPPVLTCLGNGEPMYIVRHQTGRYFARHYRGGNPDGHIHPINSGMSDEHRRQCEYSQRAAADHGLSASLEVSTGNGTRLDVAIAGDHNVGFEIQRSTLSRAKAKARTTKSFKAGWPTAWITDSERDPDWADHVPTARLTTRIGWDAGMPPRNTAQVVISDFERERDRSKRSGWRYIRKPYAVLLDELAYLMPAGEILPVAIGNKGAVVLAFSRARTVIDSVTYPGASLWQPIPATPRHQETAQRFSTECKHLRDYRDDYEALERAGCTACGQPFLPVAGRVDRCAKCAILGRFSSDSQRFEPRGTVG